MMEATQQIEEPTLERLAHSNDNIRTADGAVQFQDSILVKMAAKGQLYPDRDINRSLLAAGEKYYADWSAGFSQGLKAIDYGKASGGGGGAASHMPASQLQALARGEYRKAREVLGRKYRPAVELLLLEEQDVLATGAKISGAASPHTCRAVAIERFTTGLYLLAVHYGLLR